MFLRNIDGSYLPSFFTIMLMTDDDERNAIENNQATFVHEYIHYLQDLILPYCIRVNMSYVRWFYNICCVARKSNEIKRPFNDWDKDSIDTKMQFNYTFGENKDLNRDFKIKKIEWSSKSFSGYDPAVSHKIRCLKVYNYCIKFINGSSYHLGARDIMEYIAYKIETKHFGGANNYPRFPYRSIDILFDYYGLKEVSDEIKICIAEYCMYNDHPIHALLNLFLENEDRRKQIKNSSFETISQELLNSGFTSVDMVSESIANKTQRRLNDFKNDLQFIYGYSEILSNWIQKVGDFAKDNLSNRFIFSELYNMSKEEFSKYIKWIIDNIGLPFIINRKEKKIHILMNGNGDEFHFEDFYILQKFINFITIDNGSSKCCPICGYCEANYGIICNKQYGTQKSNDKKCPYIKFFKTHKLLNIQIS